MSEAKMKIFKSIGVNIVFNNEKDFDQFMHLVTLPMSELNKILPKELKFSGDEEYTWMDMLQECVEELHNDQIIET